VTTIFASMRQRVFLVLLGGVIASIALTALLADREGRHHFAELRETHLVDRVRQLVNTLEAVPPDTRPVVLSAFGRGINARIAPTPLPTGRETNDELTRAMREGIGENHEVVAVRGTAADCATLADRRNARGDDPACHVVLVKLTDGTSVQLVLRAASDSPWNVERSRLWLYFVFFPLCLAGLAYGVARMATAPLGRLARAAQALGQDIDRAPISEDGPTEVRAAALAFNTMQGRIRKHLEERTQILAAIAHDLQTPVTRMRLRLEKVSQDEVREKLVADLEAMQAMIRDGLDLARSTDANVANQRVDLDSLLSTVCEDAVDAGHEVSLSGRADVSVVCIAGALQRALTNVIDNAVKYGRYARIAVRRESGVVEIHVTDGGPGIPQSQLEAVFDPFYRVEASRSRDTGGTGLGLTIARNIARRCGGDLVLRNIPTGGLEAVFTLPASA